MDKDEAVNISVIWRGKKMNVQINPSSTIRDLGDKLQQLTDVKLDTMRLLLPQSTFGGSRLLTPFSDEHSSLSLENSSILEAKSIRMMGVFEDEIEEVSQSKSKSDMRIAGFDEEDRRLERRLSNKEHLSLKLPQGNYVFCNFKTLDLPGIQLNPPASEALQRMHLLASDPGIVAIMNKHRWRVGIMTELAPIGYVGVSPKCILGFNKNCGEEISLRLRTDDLKGFRKYESIKETLLHELAHMVYSEHNADFYALNKQLNEEAICLDWTRKKSYTLSGYKHSYQYEKGRVDKMNIDQKVVGQTVKPQTNPHSSLVTAAYSRLLKSSTNNINDGLNRDGYLKNQKDSYSSNQYHLLGRGQNSMAIESNEKISHNKRDEFDTDDMHDFVLPTQETVSRLRDIDEPDPDDGLDVMNVESYLVDCVSKSMNKTKHNPSEHNERYKTIKEEPDPDEFECEKYEFPLDEPNKVEVQEINRSMKDEPDPEEFEYEENGFLDDESNPVGVQEMNGFTKDEPGPDNCELMEIELGVNERETTDLAQDEPDPDDEENETRREKTIPDDCEGKETKVESYPDNHESRDLRRIEPDPDDGHEANKMIHVGPDQEDHEGSDFTQTEHDPVGNFSLSGVKSKKKHNSEQCTRVSDVEMGDVEGLQIVNDPVASICARLQKAIETLSSEVTQNEAKSVFQTLFKILRNVIEQPNESKFRKLRKANPLFQRDVASYKAAMEVLFIVGFHEDILYDENGRSESYMILKRNDPGLLWLAKSSLEACVC